MAYGPDEKSLRANSFLAQIRRQRSLCSCYEPPAIRSIPLFVSQISLAHLVHGPALADSSLPQR